MILPLTSADSSCGGKAAALAGLLRAGFAVPDGFVVLAPVSAAEVAGPLATLGGPVAVRSSGLAEDSAHASFAGQLESVLGVSDPAEAVVAIERCAASGDSARTRAYAARLGSAPGAGPRTPVIVQRLVAADVAGVAFSHDPVTGADGVVIDASWGLGESVVAGRVVPDTFVTAPSEADTSFTGPTQAGSSQADTSRVSSARHRIGSKATRLDLRGGDLVRTPVAPADRARPCLTADQIAAVADLTRGAAQVFGAPQDIEWALAGDDLWILQSRPITTGLPTAGQHRPEETADEPGAGTVLVSGVPASGGRVRGPARPVRSVDAFGSVRVGDVLVCRTTDPAWTPLFRMVSAVVTETGGPLSHASIVAREFGIPAVVGAVGALGAVRDGTTVVVDGTRGTMALPDD